MSINIANAPCSWGVEFADGKHNPPWRRVLQECSQAGYTGIELGPVGFMPEDPVELSEALSHFHLTLVGGVIMVPFHDATTWETSLNTAHRTCRALRSHGARHVVLIDSIAQARSATAGRPEEAQQLTLDEWKGFVERIHQVSVIATKEYGLSVGLHPHAGGFMDFKPEIERILSEIPSDVMGVCLDTGHSMYAGFDPIPFMREHMDRIPYVHLKNTSAEVRKKVITSHTGFYEACAQGVFCHLGDGEADIVGVRQLLLDHNYTGWCTVEQDCDPTGNTSPFDDACVNREYLRTIGFN